MAVTLFGRVEVDPMRVPLAASMDRGQDDTFASRLDAAARSAAAPPPAVEPEHAPAPIAEPERAAADDGPESADPAPVTDSEHAADQTSPTAAELASVQPHPSNGEPARRIKADEGAGSPLEFRPTAASPAEPAAIATPATATTATPTFVIAAAPAAPPSTPSVRSATDRISGSDATAPMRAITAKATLAGYRTMTRQAMQLDEQARDSVFKQILFKLDKNGGEMRLRLDPPELGELDLHLVVENGNSLRLSIGAERADLRDLLQDGLGELQQALQARGLNVAHAEVHTRQQGDGRRSEAGASSHRDAREPDESATTTAAAPRAGTGWYTAQGLDFWA